MFDKASLMYHGHLPGENEPNTISIVNGRAMHSSESVHGRDAVMDFGVQLESLSE